MKISEILTESAQVKIADAITDLYQHNVGKVSPGKVNNYKEKAKILLTQAPPSQRNKVLEILKAGIQNPYLQGAIITTVGSLISGTVLRQFGSAGLSPREVNMILSGAMNAVIPALAAKLHGMSWSDAIKSALSSVGVGVGAASVMEAEKDACYHKVKSRYKIWPSAYASGALVRCRKVGAANWGNKSKK
jgi:hypothetical protein